MYTFNDLIDLLGIDCDAAECREKALQSTKKFTDVIKNNTKISGSFDKLSDKEKEVVVDSFNKVNGFIDEFFGVKTKPYTKEDFAGSNVSVSTAGNCADQPEDEKGCAFPKKQEEKPATDSAESIADVLYKESQLDPAVIQKYVDEVVEKIVAVFTDKKNKNYSFSVGLDGKTTAIAHVTLGWDIIDSADFKNIRKEASFYENVERSLTDRTKAVASHVKFEDANTLRVSLLLR